MLCNCMTNKQQISEQKELHAHIFTEKCIVLTSSHFSLIHTDPEIQELQNDERKYDILELLLVIFLIFAFKKKCAKRHQCQKLSPEVKISD